MLTSKYLASRYHYVTSRYALGKDRSNLQFLLKWGFGTIQHVPQCNEVARTYIPYILLSFLGIHFLRICTSQKLSPCGIKFVFANLQNITTYKTTKPNPTPLWLRRPKVAFDFLLILCRKLSDVFYFVTQVPSSLGSKLRAINNLRSRLAPEDWQTAEAAQQGTVHRKAHEGTRERAVHVKF